MNLHAPVIELPDGYALEYFGSHGELSRNGVTIRVFATDTPLDEIEAAAAYDYREGSIRIGPILPSTRSYGID